MKIQFKCKVNDTIIRLTQAAFSKADPELVAASTIEAIRKRAPIISMVQKFCK